MLKADLVVGGKTHVVRLRNLSEDGALVESNNFPPEGIEGFFARNELNIRCTVVWVEGNVAGIRFGRTLKSEDVLRHVPKPRAVAPAVFKRPSIACRPITASERKMVERWMTDIRSRPGD